MIAACPNCKTRYRIDPARLGSEGARLRCKRCSAIFRVKGPDASSRAKTQAGGPTTGTPRPLVLVAYSDAVQAKRTAEALERFGVDTALAHDGVEAILTLQRTLPRAVILDAALPKMYGFQVCELVKRNESLRSTWVVLVGALHQEDRYRRPPSDLYGADAYVEPGELPDGLIPVLRRFGFALREETRATTPAVHPGAGARRSEATLDVGRSAVREPPSPAAPPAATASVSAGPEPVAPEPDALAEERAQAERLARIIVSDIVLYNEEKFAAGVQSGDPLAALREEIEEGQALFRSRVDARVREERDYLADELLRVARARGMA